MPRPAVTIVGAQREGPSANAFRVVDHPGPECFLDFLAYDEGTRVAEIVTRVRVRREFLPIIRNQLDKSIAPLPDNVIPLFNPQVTPETN